ncbi:MAG: dienelactone hydrolase family protein [Candidatus Paceibacterota bacterium]
MSESLLGYEYLYERHKGPRTLVLLHGSGGNERDMLGLGEEFDGDANMLSVRGNVSQNGINRYFRRISDGVIDREDLAKRSADLGVFIESAARKHSFDIEQAIGVGFSNGASILLHLVCSNPSLLKAAMLQRPHSTALPDSTAPLEGLPIYIGAGAQDSMIPTSDAKRLETVLRAAGAFPTLHMTQSEHRLEAEDVALAREWLATIQ